MALRKAFRLGRRAGDSKLCHQSRSLRPRTAGSRAKRRFLSPGLLGIVVFGRSRAALWEM